MVVWISLFYPLGNAGVAGQLLVAKSKRKNMDQLWALGLLLDFYSVGILLFKRLFGYCARSLRACHSVFDGSGPSVGGLSSSLGGAPSSELSGVEKSLS